MRIINNPNPKEEQTHICEKCQCEFAFNEADIRSESYSNGICGPGCYGYLKKYVLCPNCGEIFYTYDSTKEPRKSYYELLHANIIDTDL